MSLTQLSSSCCNFRNKIWNIELFYR